MSGKSEANESCAVLLEGKPDHWPAIVHAGGMLTYGDLRHRVAAISDIARQALAPGSSICLAAPSGPDFVACLFAMIETRAAISLAHHALSFAELERVMEDSGAGAVISAQPKWGGAVPCLRSERLAGDLWRHEFGARRHARGEAAPVQIYTSGTDGRPKGVIRTHGSLLAEARGVSRHLGYENGVRILCTTPLCHAYGLGMGLLGTFEAGASLIIANPGTPNLLRACVDRCGPHVVVAVPTQYDLWSQGERTNVGTELLRLCISSGAPLSEAVARRFAENWGRSPAQQYGMSETGAIAIDLEAGPHPITSGRPYPGVRVHVDTGDGASGADGEIVVRSPFLASGYVGGLERDLPRNPFSDRGFLTGDIGHMDAEGRLVVTGRRTGQINVHGNKVDPAEVEAVISRFPGVREAVVLGVPTTDGDQWIAAFVSAAPGVIPDHVVDFCQRALAPYKCPRRVVCLESIPRSAMGKVAFRHLLAMLQD